MKEEERNQQPKVSLETCLFSKESCSPSSVKQKPLTTDTTKNNNSNSSNLEEAMLAFEKRASVQKKAPVEKIDQIYTDKRSAVSVKKVAATQYSITEPSKPSVRSISKSTHTVVPKPISRKVTEDRSHESKSQKKEEPLQRQSYAEKAIQSIKDNKSIDNAIGTAYRTVKHSIKKDNEISEADNKKKKKPDKSKHEPIQNILPVVNIWNGIVKTTSGHYVKILEILPINFYDMTIETRDTVVKCFGSIFHNGPTNMHLKVVVDKANPARIISYIKSKCEEEKWLCGDLDQKVVDCAEDVINKIINISNTSALTKRYFLSYRYEGSSSDVETIYNDLETTKASIMKSFADCGNIVINPSIDDATMSAGEILYYCLNRNVCRKESLQQRINRVVSDYELYNQKAQKRFEPSDSDFLACKGLSFGRAGDYWYQEGTYKTSLVLRTKGHPDSAEPGWLNHFTSIGDGTEIDTYIRKYPHDITVDSLAQYNRLTKSTINSTNNSEKREQRYSKYVNNATVVNALNSDQDLFDVCIIITIADQTIRGLRLRKSAIIKDLSKKRLYVEDASYNCPQFFLATLPLMDIPTAIFNRNKRNYLTSSLESLYMYTSHEFYDPNGCVLGENRNPENKSVVSLNNFNTNVFANGNMSIFGMTGSGKTYSTQIIARAMRIIGIRVFFILPIKAHEYYRGCKAIAGQYIQLGPGCKHCINVCEIRPSRHNTEVETKQSSLLSQKIAFLIAWLQVNRLRDPMTVEESDIIEVELAKLYHDFGFTSDNDSAWIDKNRGIVRPSPIIGDMYDRFSMNPRLKRTADSLKKYVSGNCANMNQQTNVDPYNMYNCIDVDQDNIPKDLVPSFLFIALGWTYSIVKESRLFFDVIFFEEIWKILINEASREQVVEMVKLIRGYGGAIVPVTQDINDYLDNPAGKAILAGTATKLIMHLEAPEARRVVNELGLPTSDIARFRGYGRGDALLLTGTSRVELKVIASPKENTEFTTDPKELREMELGAIE